MSNEGNKHMHASCYLAIAIAYTIAVIAYAILAFAAFMEERDVIPPEQSALIAPDAQPDPTLPVRAEKRSSDKPRSSE